MQRLYGIGLVARERKCPFLGEKKRRGALFRIRNKVILL
jgi:hypothetical protein